MKISMDHASLAGHFPGNPVVPGVLLLDAVVHGLAAHVGRAVKVTGMPTLKFLSPLSPEQDFTIGYTLKEEGRTGFDITADGRKILTGSVTYD